MTLGLQKERLVIGRHRKSVGQAGSWDTGVWWWASKRGNYLRLY